MFRIDHAEHDGAGMTQRGATAIVMSPWFAGRRPAAPAIGTAGGIAVRLLSLPRGRMRER